MIKSVLTNSAALCVVLSASALGQATFPSQATFPFNVTPASFDTTVDNRASPSVVQLSTPFVVTLIDNTPGPPHFFRVSVPPFPDTSGQISNTMFTFFFFDGNSK